MLITSNNMPLPIPSKGYLLIEPSNLCSEQAELLLKSYACVPSFLWAAEDCMPRVLRLDILTQSEQKVVSQLLEQELSEQYAPVVCAWLESNSVAEDLADSIGKFIFGRALDGTQVVWRYYDPRIFILVASLFTEEKTNALLGPIERWTFPWGRRWWCIQRTRPYFSSIDDLQLGWPAHADWEFLNKSRLFHLLHVRLQTDITLKASRLDELNCSLAAYRETAKYLHLDDDEKRAEFAYFSTRYGRIFRENYELIPYWIKLRNKEITLHEFLENISLNEVQLMDRRLII